jgi:hypothetical protein
MRLARLYRAFCDSHANAGPPVKSVLPNVGLLPLYTYAPNWGAFPYIDRWLNAQRIAYPVSFDAGEIIYSRWTIFDPGYPSFSQSRFIRYRYPATNKSDCKLTE